MADADTNKQQSSSQTTSNAGGGGGSLQTSTGGEQQTAGVERAGTPKSQKSPTFYVDGASVSKDAYLKAAKDAGWDPDYLVERNYFPSISTK
jgi:hypothetical protein